MNKFLIGIGFAVMLAMQLWVPSKMIYYQSNTIKSGTAYKFKTRPIDPSDPFRGKYVALNFELDHFAITDTVWDATKPVYVYLTKDQDGFAHITQISNHPLNNAQDYVVAQFNWQSGQVVYFDLPFNKFYMEEGKALEAEVAVRQTTRAFITNPDQAPICYALVYVKGENATLDNVFIGEVPIREFVLQNRTALE